MDDLSNEIGSGEHRSSKIESEEHRSSEIMPSQHGSKERSSDFGEIGSDSGKAKESSYICAICDDGGKILCCDGKCMRSFHPTKEDGEMSKCTTLGLTGEQMMFIEKENFLCKNCEYKQHQCFACGVLGSSDISSGAEVFQCNDITCGHFYHAHCLAGLYYPNENAQAIVFQRKITGGLKFFCPMHKCSICGRREKKNVEGMQFAVCRRCPTSYHWKCLPRNIAFQNSEGITQRAWKDLLPNGRILIFCMRHEMQKDLGTPSRDHLIFPDVVKNNKQSYGQENEVEHLVDKCINNGDIVSEKFYREKGESSSLNRMVVSVYPTSKPPPKKGHEVAWIERDGIMNSNIPNREKRFVVVLDGGEMRQEKNVDTRQHNNMESSEVPGGIRKQRGNIMKFGHVVGAGKNKSECHTDFSVHDEPDGIDELRRPSESRTSLEGATDCDPNFYFDCFVARGMFPHPQPGSCGWLDA